MNVKMAVKMAKREGITVKTVVANDDVASRPEGSGGKTPRCGRRNLHVESRRSQSRSGRFS